MPCPATQTHCGTACVDEATDAQNCGGCGLACDHCTNGRCINILASGQAGPATIAVTASEVVWANAGIEVVDGETQMTGAAILKVPLGGGVPETLATLAQSDTISDVSSLAVDSGYVYWTWSNSVTDEGAIMKTPLAGGATMTVASPSYPEFVAVNGSAVYWVAEGGIMSAPTSGGPPTIFAPPGGPLTLAAGKAYWFDGDGHDWAIRTRELTPGTDEMTLTTWNSSEAPLGSCLATDRSDFSIYGLAVSTTDLYWYGDVANGGCLMKVPLSGGTPSAIHENAGAGGFAVDADSIYWFDRSSSPSGPPSGSFRILKAPLAGGGPVTLATSVGEVFSVVVDATSVYFTDFSGGNVVKVTPK
jgi:hypothetical protein